MFVLCERCTMTFVYQMVSYIYVFITVELSEWLLFNAK